MRKLLEQLQLDQWTTWVLLVAFVLTASLFTYQVWRIVTMKREKREHAANLPLAPDDAEVLIPDKPAKHDNR
ncbi:MAG: hypothetical protein ACFBZ8_10115 [Opitutales bacterium]